MKQEVNERGIVFDASTIKSSEVTFAAKTEDGLKRMGQTVSLDIREGKLIIAFSDKQIVIKPGERREAFFATFPAVS